MKTSAHHVIPQEDIFPHVEDEECMCGPRIVVMKGLDGLNRRIALHHPLRKPRDFEVA